MLSCFQDGPLFDDRVNPAGKSHWDIFFDYFWPSMEGKAALMDRYYANPNATEHLTWVRRNICFHDPYAEDPDWKLKQCVGIIIAAAGERSRGLSNYWKSGSGGEVEESLQGRVPYPDFGKYIDQHSFQLFKLAIPRMWAPEELWYLDYGKEPWAMFLPFIAAWNTVNNQLFDLDESDPRFILLLDEAFSFRVPKASKEGGMPNHSFEPLKPRGLGTQLKDGAVVGPNIIIWNEPVMNAEFQNSKQFANAKSLMPGKKGKVYDGTTYCLRAALATKGTKCIVGDAGFGSVEAVVHLQKEPLLPRPVESAFVVKTLNQGYPRNVLEVRQIQVYTPVLLVQTNWVILSLQAILKARHGGISWGSG